MDYRAAGIPLQSTSYAPYARETRQMEHEYWNPSDVGYHKKGRHGRAILPHLRPPGPGGEERRSVSSGSKSSITEEVGGSGSGSGSGNGGSRSGGGNKKAAAKQRKGTVPTPKPHGNNNNINSSNHHHNQDPGIDVALRNLSQELASSLRMYQGFVQGFRAQTELLRAWADETTLDIIWQNKVQQQQQHERRSGDGDEDQQQHHQRERFEGVVARVRKCRACVEEAVHRGESVVMASRIGGSRNRQTIMAQVRTGRKALVYCEGIVELASKAANEWLACKYLVGELEEARALLDWKKHPWIYGEDAGNQQGHGQENSNTGSGSGASSKGKGKAKAKGGSEGSRSNSNNNQDNADGDEAGQENENSDGNDNDSQDGDSSWQNNDN